MKQQTVYVIIVFCGVCLNYYFGTTSYLSWIYFYNFNVFIEKFGSGIRIRLFLMLFDVLRSYFIRNRVRFSWMVFDSDKIWNFRLVWSDKRSTFLQLYQFWFFSCLVTFFLENSPVITLERFKNTWNPHHTVE